MGNSVIWVLGSLVLYAISLWAELGLIGWFLMTSLVDFFWRYKLDGSITLTELKQRYGQKRVAIADVTRIAGRCWRNALIPRDVILDIYTANSCLVISVDEREVLRLIKAGFGNWTIGTAFLSNKNRFVIKPSSSDVTKHIEYDTVGRYAFSPDTILFLILFFVLGSSVVYSFRLINVWLLTGLLFTPYLFFIPSYIAKIQVTIDGKGIIVKDTDGMRVLPFADIKLVEKGFYRVKITTKSGELIYFPRACYMLAELIKEFSKEEQQLAIDTQDAD
jgi:hypothetical protein